MTRLPLKLLPLVLVLTSLFSSAQETEEIDFTSLDLEDLMNIPIVSASGKEETVFEAPLSSYSITREEIVNSGVTSIPEALRLCPGVIVREYSNGSFDVHINGFDNILRFTTSRSQLNGLTLVMIDNRPVFSYNYGFTYWEALPIDLLDVERIEVVRGPSAPLFGPNAVTGVINIITRKPANTGLDASGNVQYGSENTFIYNSAVSYKFNEKWDVTVSGNFQTRDRHDELYYDFDQDEYFEEFIEADGTPRSDDDKIFSLEQFGVNAFVNYSDEDQDINMNFSTGYTEADVQKVFFTDPAPTNNNTDNFYFNLNSQVKNWGLSASFISGFDELAEEANAFSVSTKYDFNVFNGTLDYTFNLFDNLEVVPSFNYQHIVYDDSDYIDEFIFGGPLNGKEDLNVVGGGMKLDYQPIPELRLVSAMRLDKYDVPDDTYFAYQFIATYNVTNNLLLRAVHARSNSSSFILNSFENVSILFAPPMGDDPGQGFNASGNENLNLATNTMTELGLRWQLMDNLQIDWSGFYQKLEDLSSEQLTEENPFDPTTNTINTNIQWQNIDAIGRQYGSTLSINWLPTANFVVKPFLTVQTTEVEDLAGFEGETMDHEATPHVFGGAYLNYQLGKLNININPYFTGEQTLYNFSDLDRPSDEGDISANLILNAKITYRVTDKLSAYFNGRNIGGDSRQHYGSDRVEGLYLGGLSYNF